MKTLLALTFLLLANSSTAQHHHSEHGFLLLGTGQLHAYHLAKFNSPHQYQLLFELTLHDRKGRPVDIAGIKRSSKTNVLSLLSEEQFSVTDLVGPRPLKTFQVKLFAGYLRDRENRKLLLDNLTLKVKLIRYFRELEIRGEVLERKKMIFVCDKETNEFYAAHLISSPHNSHLQEGNFEEVVRTDPFFMGWPGEDGTSVYRCEEKFQGIIGWMPKHLDAPFKETTWLTINLPVSPGSAFFGIEETLMLDRKSVNN